MSPDWLQISCIAAGLLALILAVVLGAFWLADRADDLADYERQLAIGDAAIEQLLRNGADAGNRPAGDFKRRVHSTSVAATGEQDHA